MTNTKLPLNKQMSFRYGHAQRLSLLVRRIVCNNPGPLTFKGTNTYLIGSSTEGADIAVIDPGPENEAHLKAILKATENQKITHILITHSHNDHSPNAQKLGKLSHAPLCAFWPRIWSDGIQMQRGMRGIGDKFVDHDLKPEIALQHGHSIKAEGWTLKAIHTPGHAPDHICFALQEEQALFSGDHVMGWSSTVIAPPEGNMADYMSTMDALLHREDLIYYPAHGAAIESPQHMVKAFISYRNAREQAILQLIRTGHTTIDEMTSDIYKGLDQRLIAAAKLSVLAQLQYLIQKQKVVLECRPEDRAEHYILKN